MDGISPGHPGVATPRGTETFLLAREGQGAIQSTWAKRSGNTGERGEGDRDPIRTRARDTKTNGEREQKHRTRGCKSEVRKCTWGAARSPPEPWTFTMLEMRRLQPMSRRPFPHCLSSEADLPPRGRLGDLPHSCERPGWPGRPRWPRGPFCRSSRTPQHSAATTFGLAKKKRKKVKRKKKSVLSDYLQWKTSGFTQLLIQMGGVGTTSEPELVFRITVI